jgi:CheY-like chemotaxis protein
MGGHIVMDTVPGEGTSAHVVLPFAFSEAGIGRQDAAAGRPGPSLSSLKILLVEDDSSNRFFTEKLLEKAGAHTTTASDGREALEHWKAGDFDCILMDIQMPVMDGVETTRAIRNSMDSGVRTDIPIIALTSYAMAGDRERFLSAGMDAYLGKPVRMEDLEAAITRFCKRHPDTE